MLGTRIPGAEIRITEMAKASSGVREHAKIFELVKHFVRLRTGSEIWAAGYGSGSWTEPAVPGKFRKDREFKQGEKYHAF